MTASKVACGVLLLGCAGPVFACDLPALIALPASEQIVGQEKAVFEQFQAYVGSMQTYVECVKAEIAAAGDTADTLTKSVLVKRHNNAIEELTKMGEIWDARIAPLAKETAPPPIDIPPPELDFGATQ